MNLIHDPYIAMPEPPDQLADPIGFHLWTEAHECPCCKGQGERWYECEHGDECPTCCCGPMQHECQCCGGAGLKDEDYHCQCD